MAKIGIKKLENFDSSLALPKYETELAAGADIRASLPNGEKLRIKPFERVLVPTGLAFEIEAGFEVQVRPRSGLSFKTGLMVANSPGTIDADYRGEVKVIMVNLSEKDEIIEHGDRIAQIVVAPVVQANFFELSELSDTARGTGGFGSTGKK